MRLMTLQWCLGPTSESHLISLGPDDHDSARILEEFRGDRRDVRIHFHDLYSLRFDTRKRSVDATEVIRVNCHPVAVDVDLDLRPEPRVAGDLQSRLATVKGDST